MLTPDEKEDGVTLDAECMQCGDPNAQWRETDEGEKPFCDEHAPK